MKALFTMAYIFAAVISLLVSAQSSANATSGSSGLFTIQRTFSSTEQFMKTGDPEATMLHPPAYLCEAGKRAWMKAHMGASTNFTHKSADGHDADRIAAPGDGAD